MFGPKEVHTLLRRSRKDQGGETKFAWPGPFPKR